jgi:hypothetical protein
MDANKNAVAGRVEINWLESPPRAAWRAGQPH